MKKLTMLAAGAVGYVLGTRAGKERYEDIKAKASRLWSDPRVQEKAGQAEDLYRDKVPTDIQEKVDKVAEKAAGAASNAAGSGSSAGSSAGSDSGHSSDPATPDPLDMPEVSAWADESEGGDSGATPGARG